MAERRTITSTRIRGSDYGRDRKQGGARKEKDTWMVMANSWCMISHYKNNSLTDFSVVIVLLHKQSLGKCDVRCVNFLIFQSLHKSFLTEDCSHIFHNFILTYIHTKKQLADMNSWRECIRPYVLSYTIWSV